MSFKEFNFENQSSRSTAKPRITFSASCLRTNMFIDKTSMHRYLKAEAFFLRQETRTRLTKKKKYIGINFYLEAPVILHSDVLLVFPQGTHTNCENVDLGKRSRIRALKTLKLIHSPSRSNERKKITFTLTIFNNYSTSAPWI